MVLIVHFKIRFTKEKPYITYAAFRPALFKRIHYIEKFHFVLISISAGTRKRQKCPQSQSLHKSSAVGATCKPHLHQSLAGHLNVQRIISQVSYILSTGSFGQNIWGNLISILHCGISLLSTRNFNSNSYDTQSLPTDLNIF